MKQITSVHALNSILASGIAACAEPDGTFRYLTTNEAIVGPMDTDHLCNQSGFNGTTDKIVFDVLEQKPVVFKPHTYQGVIYDLGVNEPAEADELEGAPFIKDMASPVYARRSKQRGQVISILSGSYPYVVSLIGEDGEPRVSQVNGYGIDMNGIQRVQGHPELSREEATRTMLGQIVLTKDKGPVFMSAALQAGMIEGQQPVMVNLDGGAIAVKAIQHVHRNHGVTGYEFQ